jgi:hypothetical protein
VKRFGQAVRKAARTIDVPGTPRSLRLDGVAVTGDLARLTWSFADPEVFADDRRPHHRRVRAETDVAVVRSDMAELGREAWAAAQLAAAHRYKLQIDADWIPGEPYVPRTWSVEDAWQALVGHLAAGSRSLQVRDGEIVADDGRETFTYRIDPVAWAHYLTEPEAPADGEIVPAATPSVDGLPLWATDALHEAAGAWGPVIGLVDGKLMGLSEPPR